MSRLKLGIGLIALLGLNAPAATAADPPAPLVLDVWPGPAPGEVGTIGPEKYLDETPIKRLANVSHPTLTVYRPAPEKDTGASVVICPGGGYHILAMDLEGDEVATWLNSIGVTGIVLKYRVPRREGTPDGQKPIQPLMDVQRAVRLVRSKAAEWKLDPSRIGVLGFSAGGHLSAAASTRFHEPAYPSTDAVDQVSPRPDFAVLVYPGGMENPEEADNPVARVTDETPPMFLAHAGDDEVSPMNSVLMYSALKKAGVPAELHIYASGGHGFGLRPSAHPCSTWPQRCEEWLRSTKLLAPKP
ncbi:alpha/beta hydrolase [Planctomyces sp. SH-PL62]|uniref:alpha/beta hydrolase n=1 Tax=Planctomyces sp. SH-PL62 TaxID=1636152 RepID=UPI00078C568E|nr:alpha/beta hydrolase [Planctomyces sp. SH-PL62]AMV40583.1 Acetylxylan esterase precursor [Planctomyces sp. SH-PL62]